MNRTDYRLKILVGKAGLDGHDRGVKIIARALRDAGFDVVYTGLHMTPEMIVRSAVQEDVDAIGISILSGAHKYIFSRILELLKESGSEDIKVFGGGIISGEDTEELKKLGVLEIFGPGADTSHIISWIGDNIKPKIL